MAEQARDKAKPRGLVEVFHSKGTPVLVKSEPYTLPSGKTGYRKIDLQFEDGQLLGKQVIENIILNAGKDRIVESIAEGSIYKVSRMAIGDRGTLASDSTVPKVPDPLTTTGLYNEIYRADVEDSVLNIGLPGVHEIQFVKTFSAVDIPVTSFSNQAEPVVNEVGLVMIDISNPSGEDRPPVAAPNPVSSDEIVFSLRTFKSVPFEAANEIAVTIRYTIFVE